MKKVALGRPAIGGMQPARLLLLELIEILVGWLLL